MSRATVGHNRPLFAASAAAGLATCLALAPPSHASPLAPLPLAPACDQFVFPGDFHVQGTPRNFIEGDARWQVSFTATGASAGTGPAVVTFDDGGRVTGRVIEGGIAGRDVDIHISWDNGTDWQFWGGVSDDGRARGGERLIGGEGSKDADWYSITRLACATPSAPAQQPAPPQKTIATATSDVDIYNIAHDDVDTGDGVVGAKIGTLRAGQQVELAGSCQPNAWCKIALPDQAGGFGFVLGHLQF